MSQPDVPAVSAAVPDTTASTAPGGEFAKLAAHLKRGSTSTGDRAALARLSPDALQPHELAALSRALLAAGLAPESWRADTWPRWALIAHGIALAGHDGSRSLGEQLAHAGVSESRVTKLLTSRGEAFRQGLPRLLRLLASHGVSPNWRELGELVLLDSSTDRQRVEAAEALRLRIAGPYFSHKAHQDRKAAA